MIQRIYDIFMPDDFILLKQEYERSSCTVPVIISGTIEKGASHRAAVLVILSGGVGLTLHTCFSISWHEYSE